SLAAQETRIELMVRLTPQAFAAENAQLVFRAAGFRSFFARLLPTWWSVKRQVGAWYVGGAPKTSDLLGDLSKLAIYHRRIDYCRQVQEQYAEDLLVDGEGQPDWEGTLQALSWVDRLEQFGKVPQSLRTALSTGNFDRASLGTAATTLSRELLPVRRHLGVLEQEYELAGLPGDGSGQGTATAEDLRAWRGAAWGRVQRKLEVVEGVCGVLAEGRDLPATALGTMPRVPSNWAFSCARSIRSGGTSPCASCSPPSQPC